MSRARALAAVLALALLVGACSNPFDTSDQVITARFPETFNLFTGSTVRVAGVDVGRVHEIRVSEGSDTVEVIMRITPDVQLPADVNAVIIPEMLLGERYVQLDPPYTGGPTMASGGVIPQERTGVPSEFDEVLASLNEFLEAMPEEEVARLVTNLATVLDGQGAKLGATLANAEEAVDALRESDEDLIGLAERLVTLNESLATRDEELGEFIEDFNTLATSLADDRPQIDAALEGLHDMTRELGSLLQDHRGDLEQDVATLTRVGRTAVRNLGEVDRYLFWQAELFRHAERVIDREKNWLPLVNHFPELTVLIADRVKDRVEGLCLRLEAPGCETLEETLPDEICIDPIVPCEPGGSATPLGEALDATLEQSPQLRDGLRDGDAGDGGGLPVPDVDGSRDDGNDRSLPEVGP